MAHAQQNLLYVMGKAGLPTDTPSMLRSCHYANGTRHHYLELPGPVPSNDLHAAHPFRFSVCSIGRFNSSWIRL